MTDISKINMERINGLLDKLEEVTDKLNSMKYVVETWNEGTEWYRIWSDGWIEQGGTTGLITSGDSYNSKTITFKKSFTNTNYTFTSCANKYSTENGLGTAYPPFIFTKNNTSIIIGKYSWTDGIDWYACGY